MQTNEKQPYAVAALDAAGNPTVLAATDTLVVASSNPAAASVVPDATPAKGTVASGFIVGVSPATGVVITAVLTHADGTTVSAPPVTVDVTAPAPNPVASLTLTLGPAVAQ